MRLAAHACGECPVSAGGGHAIFKESGGCYGVSVPWLLALRAKMQNVTN